MKKLIVTIICLSCISSYSQNLVSYYKIKTRGKPYALNLIKAADGNFFVFGQYDFLNGKVVSALNKVDQAGQAIPGFLPVNVDKGYIENAKALPDGKIMVQGTFTEINGLPRTSLARLNSDGSVDLSFVSEFENIYDFDFQSDGRIIVTGIFNGYKGYQYLGRLNSNGSVDETFNTSVSQIIGPGRMAVDQNDRIYYATLENLYRRTSNGANDGTFPIGAGTEASGQILRLKILPNNKVLIGGTFSKFNTVAAKFVALIQESGTVEGGFNINMGGGLNGQVNTIMIRANGNVVIGGLTTFNGQSASLVELKPDGTLSKIIAQVNGLISGMAELSNNNIVICGEFSAVNAFPKQYLAMFNASYSQVNTFTPDISHTNINSRYLLVNSLGELFVGGQPIEYDGFYDGPNVVETALARFNQLAVYDPGFQAPFDNNTSVYSIALQADDKIVASGFLNSTTNTRLIRIGTNGSIDPSFQIGSGLTQNGFTGFSYRTKYLNSKIYLAGGFDHYNGFPSLGLVALNLDGSVFKQYNSYPTGSSVTEVDLQSDGKVIVVGEFPFPSDKKRVIRLNEDGTLDVTFHSADALGQFNFVRVDSQDRIYLGGNFISYDGALVADLIRLLPDGSIDVSFNTGTGFDGDWGVRCMEILPSGSLGVGGNFYTYNGQVTNGFVLLNPDGSKIPTPQINFAKDSWLLQMKYHNNALYIGGRIKLSSTGEVFGVGKISFSTEPAPISPNTLSVSLVSPGIFSLSWSDNSNNEIAFVLERSTDETSGYLPISTLTANSITVTDTEIDVDVTYYYRIKAVNDAGDSGYSNIASQTWIIPQAPTGLLVDQQVLNEIHLTWTDNSSEEENFIIERSTSPGSNFIQIGTTASNIIEYTDMVSPNTSYTYRVAASSTLAGTSPYSNTASITSIYLPAPPSNLAVSQLNVSKITLNWDDNSDNEEGFTIERAIANPSNFVVIGSTATNGETFEDENIVQQTDYFYRVASYNFGGSNYSPTVSIKSLYPPIAPGNLEVKQTKIDEVTLTWKDNSENEAGFIIEKSTDGITFIESGVASPNAQTFKDLVGPPNSHYVYRIKSFNLVGESAYSELAQLDVILGTKDPLHLPAIYPSPISDYIYISGELDVMDEREWYLINAVGQKQLVRSTLSGEIQMVDVRHIPSGIYFLQNSKSFPIKVIIRR